MKALTSSLVMGVHVENLVAPITVRAYWLVWVVMWSIIPWSKNSSNISRGLSGICLVGPTTVGGRNGWAVVACSCVFQGSSTLHLMEVGVTTPGADTADAIAGTGAMGWVGIGEVGQEVQLMS